MSRMSNYTQNLSLAMSKVMDAIGVNEKIVMKNRKLTLLSESIQTSRLQVQGEDRNVFFFGSQSEGTTTMGLESDTDVLFSFNDFNVIQDWSESKPDKRNIMMIQEENVTPGYCLLQVGNSEDSENLYTYTDNRGRLLLKNTILNVRVGYARHGPAVLLPGRHGFSDIDHVFALPCHSFPLQEMQSLNLQRGQWPSSDIMEKCCNMECFVVAVGNKGSINEVLEWRISFSHFERYLMFNLNITQIRCYVLMKMILKTFIHVRYPESISSFMCKNVLVHCVSNTRTDEWMENNLLNCLQFCLLTLYNCVLNESCPHFISRGNNLMLRRFPVETKSFILEILKYIIESNGKALLEIKYDNFGSILESCLSGFVFRDVQFWSANISGRILHCTAQVINKSTMALLREVNKLPFDQAFQMLSIILSKLRICYQTHMDKTARNLIAQHISHTKGTVLASLSINNGGNLTYETLQLMLLGLNSDIASGKLKLASIFYCLGNIKKTEWILMKIEESYDQSVVEPICKCYVFKLSTKKEKFDSLCYESDQEFTLFKDITASCVRFLKYEGNCCPKELLHEMYRSTKEDLTYRADNDDWMDMAVVDSLPYLYFLQYKTYSRLGKKKERFKALSNLAKVIDEEGNLGHRETALNLLGQCMEKESQLSNAFICYALSLKMRGRNNSAKILICMLLNKIINSPED